MIYFGCLVFLKYIWFTSVVNQFGKPINILTLIINIMKKNLRNFKNVRINVLFCSFIMFLILMQSCVKDEATIEEDFAVATLVYIPSSSATTIQAENYDGMSGIRTGITNDNGSSGFVGWIHTGDYVEYDINIANAGSYKFDFRVSSLSIGAKFDFYQGSTKLSNVNKAATGGWDTYVTTSKTVNLSTGNSTIKILATGSSWNINWLKITPVSVDDTSDSNNLALGKSATQSTTAYNGAASRAVDGNTSGVWNQGSVTHTSNSSQPWWKVDLGSTKSIGDVVVWNRTNCCATRLDNFYIEVLNSSGSVVSSQYVGTTPSPSTTVNFNGASGSQVRVRLSGTNPLSLAEVQVFSDDSDGGGGDDSAAAIISSNFDGDWKLNGFSGSLNIGSGDYGDDGANGLDYEDRSNSNGDGNWFYEDSGYAVFKCHVGNPSSSGSGNMRSELREMNGNGNEIEWDGTTSTTHKMTYKVQLRQLPSSGKLCFGQIHGTGDFDDVIRVQLEDEDEDREANNGSGSGTFDVKIKGYVTEVLDRDNRNKTWATMQMDREYDLEIAMRNKVVTVKLDGSTIYTSTSTDSDENYFKAGAYLQSAQYDKLPQLNRHINNFGEVWIKDMNISH